MGCDTPPERLQQGFSLKGVTGGITAPGQCFLSFGDRVVDPSKDAVAPEPTWTSLGLETAHETGISKLIDYLL